MQSKCDFCGNERQEVGKEGVEQGGGLDGIKCSSCLVFCVPSVILVYKITQTKNEKTTKRKKEITKKVGGGGGVRD